MSKQYGMLASSIYVLVLFKFLCNGVCCDVSLELECQVLRKYYIELSSVLFIEDISRYFLSEYIFDTDEFEEISDAFSHKDKANAMLGIIHRKMKAGDKKVFKLSLDALFFYGIDKVQAVAEKMRRKLFEMRINRRSEIKQKMNNRIQGM